MVRLLPCAFEATWEDRTGEPRTRFILRRDSSSESRARLRHTSGEEPSNWPFGVAGHSRHLAVGPIHEDRMPTTFAKELAAVRLKVSNEIAALQPLASRSGSRMRSSLPASSRAR